MQGICIADTEKQPSSRLLRLELGTRPSKISSSHPLVCNWWIISMMTNTGCSFEMLVKNAKPAF